MLDCIIILCEYHLVRNIIKMYVIVLQLMSGLQESIFSVLQSSVIDIIHSLIYVVHKWAMSLGQDSQHDRVCKF